MVCGTLMMTMTMMTRLMAMVRMCTLIEAHACADDARSSKILLVMEYVEGGPVVHASGSQRRHLSEAIARKYFRDALQVRRFSAHQPCLCATSSGCSSSVYPYPAYEIKHIFNQPSMHAGFVAVARSLRHAQSR